MPHRISDLTWPLLIIGVVFFVSGESEIAAPHVGITLDKVGHFAVFGALATSIVRLPRFRARGWGGACAAALIAMGYGALDEYRQSFTPGRSVEFADWIADALGAATGVLLYQSWPWYRRMLEWRIGPSRTSGT